MRRLAYSSRSATMGSTLAARAQGHNCGQATTSKIAAINERISGSAGPIPNSKLPINRVTVEAPATPIVRPTARVPTLWLSTISRS